MSKIKEALRDKTLIIITIIIYINLFMIGVFDNRNEDGVLTPIEEGLWYTQVATFIVLGVGVFLYLMWASEQKEEN